MICSHIYIHTYIHTLIYTSSIIYNWEMNHSINRSIGSHFPIISHCILPYPIRLRRNKQKKHSGIDEKMKQKRRPFLFSAAKLLVAFCCNLPMHWFVAAPSKKMISLSAAFLFSYMCIYINVCVCCLWPHRFMHHSPQSISAYMHWCRSGLILSMCRIISTNRVSTTILSMFDLSPFSMPE